MSSDDSSSIEALILKYQRGIDQASTLRKIFQETLPLHGPTHRFFLRKGFSGHEALELTQETIVQAIESIRSYRQESSFKGWWFGVAHHVYHNEIRRLKRRATELPLETGESPVKSPQLSTAEPEAEGLDRLVKQERLRAFRRAIKELPPQMAMCCRYRYERGLKYREIAVLMGLSIETVKAHLHQARKRLTEKLASFDQELHR